MNKDFYKSKASGIKLITLWIIFFIGLTGFNPKSSDAPQLTQSNTAVSLAAIVSFEAGQSVTASYRISDGATSWQAHSRGVAFASQNKLQTKQYSTVNTTEVSWS